MIARGYVRVSTDEQAQEGVSIEAQVKILEAYAVVRGFDDMQIYIDDGYSGKNLNRPQVRRLLDECRTGTVDAVIVWRLDRISRSLRDTLTIVEDVLQANNVTLLSVTESIDTSTPSGRLMLNILATFAQHERESDVERVTMAHRHLAADCRYLGGYVPLGYQIDADKHYQIDPQTAPIVRSVFNLYISGAGYTEILRYLDQHGIRSAKGGPYTKTALLSLLTNEKYIGTYIYSKLAPADARGKRSSSRITPVEDQIRIPNGIPAIIDRRTWDAACAMRERNKRAAASYRAKEIFPLSGLVFCGECGKLLQMRVAGRNRLAPGWQHYYRCTNKCCKPAERHHLERCTWKMVEAIAKDRALLDALMEILHTYDATATSERNADIHQLQNRLAGIEKRISNILRYIESSGSAAPAALSGELATLETSRGEIQAEIDHLGALGPAVDFPAVNLTLSDLQTISKMPPEYQRKLIQAAGVRVEVTDEDYIVTLTGIRPVEMRRSHTYACQARMDRGPYNNIYTYII